MTDVEKHRGAWSSRVKRNRTGGCGVQRMRGSIAVVSLGVILLGGSALGPEALSAQSLLGQGGLGFPVEPIGARAHALGGLGIALSGADVISTDPAMAADLVVPTVTATIQPSWSTVSLDGSEESITTNRFPMLAVGYPVPALEGVVSVSFEGYLDQSWEVEEESTIVLDSEAVEVVDRFRSDGGVSAVRLSWAQRIVDGLDLAVAGGIYLGDVERSVTRSFDTATVNVPVARYQEGGKWSYTGPTVTVGARWEPSPILRLSGSVDWSGRLHGKPVAGTEGPSRDVDLPTVFRFGVGGALSTALRANAGVSYGDWSSATEGLHDGAAVGEVWNFGGGVEWDGPTLLGRNVPLRVGYRMRDLPFRFQGEDPEESALTFGLGLNLRQAQEVSLAAIDVGVELGDREAGPLSESFTRATITVRVAGN